MFGRCGRLGQRGGRAGLRGFQEEKCVQDPAALARGSGIQYPADRGGAFSGSAQIKPCFSAPALLAGSSHAFLTDRLALCREIAGFGTSIVFRHLRKTTLEPLP